VYQQLFTFGAAFLGSAVESTEALTIVLAVGLTRGWRSPLYGTVLALVSLAVLVVLFGQLIVQRVPDSVLKLIIGTLLLLFGLRWLHKAVLRSAGVVAMHDEEHAYQQTVNELRGAVTRQDWVGFVIAFKGVFLEGLEVVFIVLTFGANQHDVGLAAVAAAIAVLFVLLAGAAVHAPLSRVPENTMKFVVGAMLTSFGLFWGAEGAGAHWPGSDAALLVIIPVLLAFAAGIVAALRRRLATGAPQLTAREAGVPA
jgi:uncharacterized membrane protein